MRDLEDGVNSGFGAESEISPIRRLHGDSLLDLLLAHEWDIDPVGGRDGHEGHEPAYETSSEGRPGGHELVKANGSDHAGGRSGYISNPQLLVTHAHRG